MSGVEFPCAVAVNSVTNKIYVGEFGGSKGSVTVIDGATNTTTTVPSGFGSACAIAVNPVTNKVYAPDLGANDVLVIDGATNATTTVPTGSDPFAKAVNSVTNEIYVVNANSGHAKPGIGLKQRQGLGQSHPLWGMPGSLFGDV